jgi:hypothetical protein
MAGGTVTVTSGTPDTVAVAGTTLSLGSGNLNAGTKAVTLTASSGAISGSGVITGVTLTVSAGGAITLNGTNMVDSLVVSGAGGDVTFKNGKALSLGSTAGLTAYSLSVEAAEDITMTAGISTSGSVSLKATGSTRDILVTQSITGTAGVSITATRTIQTINPGAITTGDNSISLTAANIVLNAGAGLSVGTGPADITLTADSMTIGAAVNAGTTGTVALRNAGSGTTFSLGTTGGDIGVVTTNITAGTLEVGSFTAGNITVDGAFSVGGTLRLVTGGTVSQNAALTAGTLEVTAAGGITLNDSTNVVGTFRGTTTNQPISIANSGALTLGAVDAGSGAVTLTNTTGTVKIGRAHV